MKLNATTLRDQFDQVANEDSYLKTKVSVKLKKDAPRLRVDEYERKGVFGYNITINPAKIRNDNQLDNLKAEVNKQLAGL